MCIEVGLLVQCAFFNFTTCKMFNQFIGERRRERKFCGEGYDGIVFFNKDGIVGAMLTVDFRFRPIDKKTLPLCRAKVQPGESGADVIESVRITVQ